MTDRDWRKAGVYTPDPGAVIEGRDTGGVFCGDDDRPFVPKSVQAKKRASKVWRRFLRTGVKGKGKPE